MATARVNFRGLTGRRAEKIPVPKDDSDATDPNLHSNVYFFLSMDLVNSTKFKTAEPGEWLRLIGEFYEQAAESVLTHFSNASTNGGFDCVEPKLWKYIGDEVLFYLRLRHEKQATSCVDAGYSALSQTRVAIEATTDSQVSVKGTCWVAVVQYV
ncbi:MAG: hypothetical protein FWD57_11720, partial [Polyangiaceae bacterium]|nr:hypothetical protein [Polyangiaceae bacterium]